MTKLFSFSAKLPESIQNQISEVADLLGHSKNKVVIEMLKVGLDLIYSQTNSEPPPLVMFARSLLRERGVENGSKSTFSLVNTAPGLSLDGFSPSFKAKLLHCGLNGGQVRGVRHLMSAQRITRSEYESIAQTTSSTAKRQLADLIDIGVLVKKGRSRNSWYEFANGVLADFGENNGPKRTAMSRNGQQTKK
jgi:hypothetical protein